MKTTYEPVKSPQVDFARCDDGRIVSAYIRLRTGKAVTSVQPNPKCLVYFELGRDELPVGISFQRPYPGVALSLVIDYLASDEDCGPVGVGRAVEHGFLPLPEHEFRRFLKALKDAIEEGESALPKPETACC